MLQGMNIYWFILLLKKAITIKKTKVEDYNIIETEDITKKAN